MEDKKVSKQYLQTYITEKGLTPDRAEKLVNDLSGKGYVIEGYNEPKPTMLNKIGENVSKRVSNVGQSISDIGNAQGALETVARAGAVPLRAVGQAAGAVGDVIGGAVGAGLEATGLDKPLAEGIQKVAETAPVKAITEAYGKLPQEIKNPIGDITNIATTYTGGNVAKAVGKGTTNVAGKVATTDILRGVKAGANGTVDIAKLGLSKLAESGTDYLAKGVTEDVAQKTMQEVASRIDKYTQEFVKSSKLAQEAESKLGESVGSYLVRRGIVPTATEAGKFDVIPVISKLEKENLGLQKQVAEKLKQSTSQTSLPQLYQEMVKKIEIDPRIPTGDIDTAKSYLDKYFSNAITRYGDNVTDEELYRLKIDADKGFNYTSATGEVNGAKYIADNMRGLLKRDTELADLLDAESKNFEVINLVDKSLAGKTIGGGRLTTRLAQLGLSTITAGSADSTLGKIASAIGGVFVGDKAVDALRKVAFAGPVERKIIENYINPKIISKLEKGAKITTQEKSIIEKGLQAIKAEYKKFEDMPNKQGGFIKLPTASKVDDISTSIQKAKASGQSFDEWVKGQGETVYHATKSDIKEFGDIPRNGTRFYGKGTYFSNNIDRIKEFGDNVIEAKLGLKNPYTEGEIYNKPMQEQILKIFGKKKGKNIIDSKIILDSTKVNGELLSEMYKKAGYDGVIARGGRDIAVFNPKELVKTRSQLKALWNETK